MKQLTQAQLAECKRKAARYNSTLEQECFLARGGTLKQWYELDGDRAIAYAEGLPSAPPSLPGYTPLQIQLRLIARLNSELGPLSPEQAGAIDQVACLVACAPNVEQAANLEELSFQRAMQLAGK